ncbi:hypothetical protein [Shewanella holmiensis]|uniref:Uncharacterized protein n=1 Tax=Shewanella holmiensis TaxID=2952222 RepID=A0A9X3AVN0_9GAMM|nr:hypothetical protein [Shewanella holmiensis]MCT7941553.1 hypothetical protein [Shewanella holmiensis]
MDNDSLQLWNVIGTWLASIGTIGAVITSLWLANRQGKIHLGIVAGHRQLVTRGSTTVTDLCMIKIVNKGTRPAKITGIGWESGRFKKKIHLIQMFGTPDSDNVPKTLQEGEEGAFLVPFHLDNTDKDWIISLPKELTKNSERGINGLKVCVSTSVGQSFKVKAEKGLKDKLRESLKASKALKRN